MFFKLYYLILLNIKRVFEEVPGTNSMLKIVLTIIVRNTVGELIN